ncbi:MAG: ThiF family adenylyltransferase [Nitrosopumilaceae archaeon]
MIEVRVPQNIWQKAYDHLFNTAGEHFAFFLAETTNLGAGTALLVNDVILIHEKETETEFWSAKIKLDTLLKVTNSANSKKLALIEIHNHGSGFGQVHFSGTDHDGFKEFVPYVLDVHPNFPYVALVTTKDYLVDGLYWNNDGKESPICCVKIVGTDFKKLITTSGKKLIHDEIPDESYFSRQFLAFGKEGQKKFQNTRVAIVGLGGMGSHIAEQLSYLGVRDFVLIDPDLAEESNLNRLIGATINDVGKPKVNIISERITKISNNKAKILSFKNDIRNESVFNALKKTDVIFGCIDNDAPRLILNELSFAYLINYIDCGTGIIVDKLKIESAGGQIIFIHPDGPCMSCSNSIDLKEVTENLLTEQEIENQKRVGYVEGAAVHNPSVVSLNGVIASLAVTEFIKLVTGYVSPKPYTVYDMLESRELSIVLRHVTINQKCLHYSWIGIGDKIHLERYLIQDKVKQKNSDGGN